MPTRLRLLLVEDSERDAALLVRLLRQAGYDVEYERVESAGTMALAIEKAAWDLVIADFAPPSFSAAAALKLVTARGLDLPFIIVSGTIRPDLAAQMMQVGAHDFISKDDLARLLPTIERELRAAADRRARHAAEAALRSVEESLRLLFAASPQPLWLFDLETLRFLDANEVACARFGRTREAFHASQITDFWPDEAVAALLAAARQPGPGLRQAVQWRHRLKEGRSVDMKIAAHGLQLAGRAAGLVLATEVAAGRRQRTAQRTHGLLTAREQEVLGLLVQGLISNRELAARLVVSENTVKYHLRNIMAKLQLRNRAQVIAYAVRHQLVEHPGRSS